MSSNKALAIATATLPRDARVPSDMTALLAVSPLEHTFAAFGKSRINALKADYIASLIADALAPNASA
jgi:hypothetical protein